MNIHQTCVTRWNHSLVYSIILETTCSQKTVGQFTIHWFILRSDMVSVNMVSRKLKTWIRFKFFRTSYWRFLPRKKWHTQLTNYTMIYMLCRSMTYFFKRSYLLYVAISIINYQWSFKATSGDLTKCINMEHEVVVIVL